MSKKRRTKPSNQAPEATPAESLGDRWTVVVNAKPGEPFAYLEGDQSSGAAYLVEVTNDRGESRYEAFTADATRLVEANIVDETRVTQWATQALAARAMERAIAQQRNRQRKRSEFVQELRGKRGQQPEWEWFRERPGHIVKIWEAIALSLNIHPGIVSYRTILSDQSFRTRLLDASRSSHDELPRTARTAISSIYDEDSMVVLSQFAAWASWNGWQIPPELKALATTKPSDDPGRTEGEQQPKPRISDGITMRLREKYFELYDQHGKLPSQRALERETTYSRNAIRRRWDQVKAPRDADKSS